MMHSTMCCGEGVDISISWCLQEELYIVRDHSYGAPALWEDEPYDAEETLVKSHDELVIIVRSCLLRHRPKLLRQGRVSQASGTLRRPPG